MALFELTGREAPLNPPMEGPFGLRSLADELADARVAISEAMAHPEFWGVEGCGAFPPTQIGLDLLAKLADALESGNHKVIDKAWQGLDLMWSCWREWVPLPGLDAVVWRAMYRVRSACREGSKAKWPNYRDEARRLGQVCRTV